jgi:hypothetical protein
MGGGGGSRGRGPIHTTLCGAPSVTRCSFVHHSGLYMLNTSVWQWDMGRWGQEGGQGA